MQQRAKGRRSVGNSRREVQAEPAGGRASGAGAAEQTGRAARRGPSPPRAHSAPPSPPTFNGPGTGLRPGAAG